MADYIDSRPGMGTDSQRRMRANVEEEQRRRAAFVGPVQPAPGFSLDGVEKRARDARESFVGPMPGPAPARVMVTGPGMMGAGDAGGGGGGAAPMPVPDMRSLEPRAPRLDTFGPPAAAPGAADAGRGPMWGTGPMTRTLLGSGAPARGLGGVAPVKVGRSRFDVNRMAETMVRRRDPRGVPLLFGLKQQQVGIQQQQAGQAFQREMTGRQEGFTRERDAARRDYDGMMFGKQQQAEAERDAREFGQGFQMFGLQQDAEADRYARERRDKMTDDQRRQGFTLKPLDPNDPSKGTAIIRGDGSIFNTLPGPKGPPAAGMLPIPGTRDAVPIVEGRPVAGAGTYTENPGWSVSGQPKYAPATKAGGRGEKPNISWQDDGNGVRVPYETLTDPRTGEVVVRKVRVMDANQNGIPDAQEGGAAGAGAGTAPKKAGRFASAFGGGQ